MRVSDIVGEEGIEKKHLIPYTYPSDNELSQTKVTGLFLGYYLPWDGLTNALVAQANGFRSYEKTVEGSMVNYENLDNHQTGIHDYFKFLKFGCSIEYNGVGDIKYKITKIEKIESFELKSFNLRSYYHNNILAFGDLLHRIHPLAGQGFNMTIRDINVFIDIIKNKIDLGLPIDSSVNYEFEKNLKHKNYIFSNSIDFVQEFFNFERKFNNNILSKSVKILGKNRFINKLFTKVADKGINF